MAKHRGRPPKRARKSSPENILVTVSVERVENTEKNDEPKRDVTRPVDEREKLWDQFEAAKDDYVFVEMVINHLDNLMEDIHTSCSNNRVLGERFEDQITGCHNLLASMQRRKERLTKSLLEMNQTLKTRGEGTVTDTEKPSA